MSSGYSPSAMAMAPQSFKMLVDGKLVGSDINFGVINPSTGEVFAQCPECSKDTLNEAIASAKKAFKRWRVSPFDERAKCLSAAVGKIKEAMPKIADVLVKEQGKPFKDAMGEIGAVMYFLAHFATLDVPETVLVDNDDEKVIEKNVPLGVVGGITPWNFPPLMAAWKIGEAVMTGNSIVLKPSPFTPLSTLMIGECFAETFPAGVVNVVSGGNDVGLWISQHPDIAKISFTGSTRTGKAIQAETSGTLKRLTLELGGNDAAIVLAGADVKNTAKQIFEKAMMNTGQVCIAVKRCYVPENMQDEFLAELTKCAAEQKVGDGFGEGVTHGPIQNKMQFDRVCELVEDAKKSGCKINAGGEPVPGKGYFYPLTIISGVKEGVRIVDEEQFGPVLPVMTYSDEADVVDRANDTTFGLGASVWGPQDKAIQVAGQIDAGTVWVNSHAKLSPNIPFGGRKESGLGRQMGDASIDGYMDKIVIRIPKIKDGPGTVIGK